MATKVFYRCKMQTAWWTRGREYQLSDGVVIDDDGSTREEEFVDKLTMFERIEREVFEAGGFEWFRHAPGEPMPCDALAMVQTICQAEIDGNPRMNARTAESWSWDKLSSVIGWRFADSEQKEPEAKSVQIFGSPIAVSWERYSGVWIGEARIADVDEGERNDLIAAVDDGHLKPGQKRHWDAMEEKQAERERAAVAKEKLDKSVDEKHIRDLAKANGAVKFEHDHRLGWMT